MSLPYGTPYVVKNNLRKHRQNYIFGKVQPLNSEETVSEC